MDRFPNVNSFLSKYFINRGETQNRWELKPHALHSFYRSLSHWCIFLTNPSVYGWKDNTKPLPSIDVKYLNVPLTDAQWEKAIEVTGNIMGIPGGIGERSKVAQIAKSSAGYKPKFIADLARASDAGTIIWCKYNEEQDELYRLLPEAANISGDTPENRRIELIREFKQGTKKIILTKDKILGYGLNLQMCHRMIFSTLMDSAEGYYQCIKRANRYGSVHPLEVLIPATDIELTMVNNVFRKLERMEQDNREQEKIFRQESIGLM
jgi:superfamily II DNA/RNA helicase